MRDAALRDALDPFLHPRSLTRRQRAKPRDFPEDDKVVIEVTAGDMWRLAVLAGETTVEEIRRLPMAVRPGVEFIMELERLGPER